MMKARRRRAGTRALLGLTTVLAAACGALGSDPENEPKLQEGSRPKPDPSRTTPVSIALQSASGGFQLTQPTSDQYIVHISNCASGYTTTVTSTAAEPITSVPLYTGDGGCDAELEEFAWDGITYTKSGGGTLVSGSALFTDGGTNNLYVTVATALDATIGPSSEALFVISESKAGEDYAISGYSTSAPLTITAVEAPELEIPAGGITLASIDADTGIATFTVNLQCRNILSPSDQLFSNMKVKLAKDTYAGKLDYAAASTVMASATTSVIDPDNLSTAAPITTEGFVVSLDGPGQLYFNKNMLLVVEYSEPGTSFKSFRYFNVDIGDPE
jgi:hypothetical protein